MYKTSIVSLITSALFISLLITSNIHAREMPSEKTFSIVRHMLDIDSMPLNEKTVKVEDFSNYTRETVLFDGFDRETVNGFLAIPKGVKKAPVVILLHGITQSKHQWWAEAGPYSFPGAHRKALINNGFAVLALDARSHGERIMPNDFANPYEYVAKSYINGQRDLVFDSAKDTKRAIDYLASRDDIDIDRIAVMGYSLGAMISWAVASTDNRVKVMVSIAAPIQMRLEAKEWDIYSPIQFTPGLKSTSVLMIAAEEDYFYSKDLVETVFSQLPSRNKKLKFYPGGHDMSVDTLNASIPWIKSYLK